MRGGPRNLAFFRELPDRLVQHPAIEIEPHGCDVAVLLGAEDVARTADLEVLHREVETGPEVAEAFDRLEAPPGLLGEDGVLRHEKISERRAVEAADAAAQLVKLREPE